MLAVTVAALVAACWIVFGTAIGPMVVSVSEHHGIHAGDLLALPLLGVAVLSFLSFRRSQRQVRTG